jgi:hypothetical protein
MRKLALVAMSIAIAAAMMTGVATAREADKSADEIVADAAAALQSAKSVDIRGSISSDDGRITLNLASGHGEGGGVMFINGKRFDFVLHTPDVYIKANHAAWVELTGTSSIADLVADRWMKSNSSEDSFASLAKLLDLEQMSQSLLESDTPVTKGTATRFRGKPAISLNDNDEDPGTLYLAAKGAPRPLAIVSTTGKGEILFSKYNSAKIPSPPSSAIDLSALTDATTTDQEWHPAGAGISQ